MAAMENGGDTSGHQPGSKCCVCLEEVDYRGTALVQCRRCQINVHVKCYGVTVPTDGSPWLCEPCTYMEASNAEDGKPRMQPYCIACPTEGGALRQANQAGVWCHVLCINWIPELSHSLSGEMNEVLDIRVLDRSRQSLKCSICGLKGGCIQCVSGRCAKAFHVICAMRVHSDTVFTGYNNENQQVYHCKTHLGDIATFKYEMVDSSWKKSPLMIKFLEETPASKSKCRVCSTKVPPNHFVRHEEICLIGWLAKEETRIRRARMQELGIAPAAIDFSGAGNVSNRSDSTPSKNRKNSPPMRPCPQCGEQVRETLMMGHMKNNCTKMRGSAKRAKNPAAVNRQQHMPQTLDLTQDELPTPAIDLTDVLYATWPGQAAGSLLDSTNFWRILNNNFFSNKILLKKRMEPICKNLCGARLEDMGDFNQKTSPHDSIKCSDTVLFERGEDSAETLIMSSIIHRCDFMMRGSRMRCIDDLFVKPLAKLTHRDMPLRPEDALNGQEGNGEPDRLAANRDLLVHFKSTEGESASCRFAFRLNDAANINESGEIWSRYHPDAVSAIVGAGLEKFKPVNHNELWVSLQDLQSPSSSDSGDVDELTPEISLLVEQLREQMRSNRYRVRALCRRTQEHDYAEDAKLKERYVVETYFKEFALWKALCKSLLIGYREFWKPVLEEELMAKDGDKSQKPENEEEPVDDGTCVVCFDGQSPESNPIIFCDRCDLAVHQRCYGIPHVPSNEFYCDRCRLADDGRDPAAEVYCQLCPLRDGAFKKTIDGKWVHVVCALWCPGVWIGNLQTLSDIKLVDSAHRTRFLDTIKEVRALIDHQSHAVLPPTKLHQPTLHHGSLCRYCRVACGRTIGCSHDGCSESFHPLCAWFEGYPMTTHMDTKNGFVYSGGGSGLLFKMFCGSHLPAEYTRDLRVAQAKHRRRFRIDSFYNTQSKLQPVSVRGGHKPTTDDSSVLDEWIDRELCAACFDYASPVSKDVQDLGQLSKRQLMMRCQYCNTFIHAACCLSEVDDVTDLFRSNWICERCTLVGQSKKSSTTGCAMCDRASDYMMPCVGGPSTPPSSVNTKLPQVVNGSKSPEVSTNASSADRWIHVLCAKMAKVKLFKRHGMICATQPVLTNESHGKCDICQTRGRNLAGCGGCSKRFHPTCAARKKCYVSRSNKSEWKFYCPSHPPHDVAYDEKRQAWFTGEILAHLHELRHVLERGRMIVEMARQRDRQKKRMMNLCSIKTMELSMEMILKKRPTPIMKEVFTQFTGESLEEVPKRLTTVPSRSAKAKGRARVSDDNDEDDNEIRRSSRLTSSSDENGKRIASENGEFEGTPRKRRRVGDDDVEDTPSRRSSRRIGGSDIEESDMFASPNRSQPVRASSRARSAVVNYSPESGAMESRPKRNRELNFAPDECDFSSLLSTLNRVTRSSDFDDVLQEVFPELF